MFFSLENNHIIVDVEGKKYLIDIGSPFSFSYIGEDVVIDGKTYSIGKNTALVSRASVEKLTGASVDGLIGLDIILKTGMTVDYAHSSFLFSVTGGSRCCSLAMINGYVYTKDFVINGSRLSQTVIDTGACIPYVDAAYLNESRKTDEMYSDYNPLTGEIKGYLYEVDFGKADESAGQYRHTVKVGELPWVFKLVGIKAIVNLCDIVKDEEAQAPQKTVSLDFDAMALYIR